MIRRLLHLFICLLVVVFLLGPRTPASAETPVGFNIDHRVIVAIDAPAAGVQHLLPKGWVSMPFPAGPVTGANILFVFADTKLQLGRRRPTLSPATRHAIVLVGMARKVEGDEVRLFVLRIYSTTPEVDPYGVSVAAKMSRQTQLIRAENGVRTSIDTWKMHVAEAQSLDFRLGYTAGIPMWGPDEVFPHSASTPEFSRIYRIEQMVDLVKSVPLEMDRVSEMTLTSSVPALAGILDGSEEIVAVMDVPVYLRHIWLP